MRTPLEHLVVFVEWTNRDLDGLSPGDWLNFMEDLGWSLTRDQAQEMLLEIRDAIYRMATNGSVSFDEKGTRHIIGRSGGKVTHSVSGNHRARIMWWVFQILEKEGHRLRKCPECEERKVFVRIKRGEYCSLACSQHARQRRYFASHSKEEMSKRRHARYIRGLL